MFVCKRFLEAVDENQMWRMLCEKRWVFLQKKEEIKDWKQFYKRRKKKLYFPQDETIENCFEW